MVDDIVIVCVVFGEMFGWGFSKGDVESVYEKIVGCVVLKG